jgi:hypothetical protein
MTTTSSQSKLILNAAALYNLAGGLSIIFLLEVTGPLVGFAPDGNMLFRLFVGGTAITFGLAYGYVARTSAYGSALLAFGTGLKYWAFVASLISHLFFGLSLAMLLLFGVPNLIFAVLFSMVLRRALAAA